LRSFQERAQTVQAPELARGIRFSPRSVYFDTVAAFLFEVDMRPFSIIGLLAVSVALAGCGSSPTARAPGNPFPPPTSEQLKEHASRFQNEPKSDSKAAGAPMPLKFVDKDGKEVDLLSFRDKSNVVLAVVKGLPSFPGGVFCPGCLAQLNSLTANHDEFKKRGAEVVMMFPGSTDSLAKFFADGQVDGANLPFPIVTDKDLKAVGALGINGDLARPATYILDKKGNVVFAYVAGADTTYDRPSVKALLDQLDKLNAQK
jgi:peroxiredoxin